MLNENIFFFTKKATSENINLLATPIFKIKLFIEELGKLPSYYYDVENIMFQEYLDVINAFYT